jgi:hypothetical protein
MKNNRSLDQIILEVKTKSLSKLGTDPVIAVVTDFPKEFLRMLFQGLRKVFDIPPEVPEQAVQKMGELTIGSSLSNRNPWLDANNDYKIEFTDKKSAHEVEITLNFVGNEAVWGVSISYDRVLEKRRTLPIRIGKMTANEFVDNFVGKMKQIMTDLKPRWPRTPDNEEAEERAEKGLKKELPDIINKLQPFAKKNLLFFGEERNDSKRGVHRLFLRPSFSKYGIGNWSREIGKVNWGDINGRWSSFDDPLRSFNYAFQVEMLAKTMPLFWKRLRDNNILVMNGGYNGEYIWLDTSPAPRNSRHPDYRKKDDGSWVTYDEVERSIEARIADGIEGSKEKAKKMTLDEFMQFLIKTALAEKKEEE